MTRSEARRVVVKILEEELELDDIESKYEVDKLLEVLWTKTPRGEYSISPNTPTLEVFWNVVNNYKKKEA